MQKIVLRIQQRSIPHLISVAVKLVRSRFSEIVHLRCPISTLVDGKRIGIDSRLLHSIEADDQVRR